MLGTLRLAAIPSALTLALVLLTIAPAALAVVHQPDGTLVPVGGSLNMYLTARGETIDVINDAAVTPERFVPGCTIRFTVVDRDSGYVDTFGWYNVQAGRAPTAAELFELVGTSAGAGFTATLDLRTDSRYSGGEIGFYLHTPPGYIYYTERAYQPDSASTGGFVHVLIYDSHVTPNAFYFAWEDLYGGGDNDFQDLLIIVDNLVCSGGGAPCDTGMPGACAAGIQQCRSGALACVPTVTPSPEHCDGVDNDCNGMVDDGMGLCPLTQVCDRGQCVDHCVEGSCFSTEVCSTRGTCVEVACAEVTCPAGQRCVAGSCVGQCDGVVCPHGQTCRAGRCVDPCAGLTCEADQTCVDGVCQTGCSCHRCATSETCASDGRCVPSDCATVTCAAGTYCAAGACVDACSGAHCPTGQACAMGACHDLPPMSDAGVADGSVPDASAGDAGHAIDSGRDGGRDGGRDSGSNGGGVSGSCGCRAAGSGHGCLGPLFSALAALACIRRRRRAAHWSAVP